jgi:ribosomal protein S3
MGLIIGKEGRTINSIRSLAKAKAVKEGVWVDIQLLNNQVGNKINKQEEGVDDKKADDQANSTVDVAEEATDQDHA